MKILDWFFSSSPQSQQPERVVLGITITNDRVLWARLVMNNGGTLSIQGHGRIALPAGVVVGGSIQNPHELVRALLPLRVHHLVPVACALPAHYTQVFKLSVPLEVGRDAEQSIQTAITDYIMHVPEMVPEDAVCEYEIMHNSETHISVHGTLYARSRADAYRLLLGQAGFREIETYSLPASLAHMHGDGAGPYIMLDIGVTETHIALVVGTRVAFIKTVPVGEENLLNTIQSYVHVSPEEARKIYKRYGIMHTHRESALRGALHKALVPITDTIQSIIDTWQDSTYTHQTERGTLSEIVVLGEGAHMKGLLDYLYRTSRLGARHINVWRLFPEIQDLIPEVDWYDALRFAPAIAVALEKIRKNV